MSKRIEKFLECLLLAVILPFAFAVLAICVLPAMVIASFVSLFDPSYVDIKFFEN